MVAKAKVVAFAYDNPVFEDQAASRTEEKEDSITVEVRIAHAEPAEEGLEKLVYQDVEALCQRLVWQYWSFQFLVLTSILVITYTDPLDNPSITIQVLLYSIQVGLLLAIMVAFFVFTSQTIFIKFGRYDKYLYEYKVFYITLILEFLVILAAKIYFIIQLTEYSAALDLWRNSIYFGVWVAQRLVLLLFWVTATYSASQVFKVEVYSPDYMLSM